MSRKSGQDFFLFLIGGALFAAGIFLFTSQVMVGSGSGFGLPWGRGFQRGTSSFLGGFFNFGVGEGFGLLMIPVPVQRAKKPASERTALTNALIRLGSQGETARDGTTTRRDFR